MYHKRPVEISIIVPIYNMEKYLEQCLNSIKNQTFRNWECLLIDDGSSDSSAEICKTFQNEDERFRYIYKENEGVSSARNRGLELAEGNFIGWVDPDDWIEPGMFERLYHMITGNKAEIAQIGYWKEYTGFSVVKKYTQDLKVMDGKSAYFDFAFDKLPNGLWNKLYRKQIIDTPFPVGKTYEDLYANGHWLKNVKKFVIDPQPMYHYRMRKGSIVHSNYIKNRINHLKVSIDVMDNFEKSCPQMDLTKRKASYINRTAVVSAKNIARWETDPDVRLNAVLGISKIIEDFPLTLRHMNLRNYFRAKLLHKNPRSFIRWMRFTRHTNYQSKRHAENLFD